MTKYILFCAQEAGFRTRSMLIPYDLIMSCPERKNDLQILRKYCQRDVVIDDLIVDQLLIEEIIWTGHVGRPNDSPFLEIVFDLRHYADGMMDDDCFMKEYDRLWANNIICGVASEFGSEHISNYCSFRNRTTYNGKPIEIVEGFLVLQVDRK